MELIDTHAHLDFPEFDLCREEVLSCADNKGVTVINSCLNPKGFELMRRYKKVFLTLGCGPYKFDEYDIQYKLIKEHIKEIVAVGEIGLDYYWVKEAEKRELEKEQFTKLLKLAKEYDMPVVIHSRDAESDALELLEQNDIKKAIMHCFSGNMTQAERAIAQGYLISIPTNLLKSKQKQKFAKKLPLESIVLETDSPYLCPFPGKVNEPIYIIESAKKIAEIRGIDYEEVAEATTKNAKEFFGI
jgi:TatD DNase family protein